MSGLSTPRVLLFSQRNIFSNYLFRCPHFEFEDIISEIDSVDVVASHANPLSTRNSLVRGMAYHTGIWPRPDVEKVRNDAEYDLFFAMCGYVPDLLMLDAAIDWKKRCKLSVCMIDELWINEISQFQHFFRILKKFDLVVLYYSQSVKPLSDITDSKCMFLPPGIDTLLFSPYPKLPGRSIDVYSIGRRSEVTHRALMELSTENGLFYLHDSIAGNKAIDPSQHRSLFANTAKRSRYFIVNPGLIDQPQKTNGQIEVGNRYFEGAAAGTIMIGERPETESFKTHFDWTDSVIHLPYGSADIEGVINDLDKQPERQEEIRQTNVVQSLLRHDWVYRWESILQTVGLEPRPELLGRKDRLRELAMKINARGADSRWPTRAF